MNQEECKKETKQHIGNVQILMLDIIHDLINRAHDHDLSKLESPELETFTEFTPKLKQSTYGSKEYGDFLKNMKGALDHHYKTNRHHPEHFSNGIKGMNLVDVIEMICDWKASSMRHSNGNIEKSIEMNQERFGYSDDLKQILLNTIKDYF